MIRKVSKTKNQHYYPRGLLKHFADDDRKVFVYNRTEKKFRRMSYETICYHKYTYETADRIDNILENHLGQFENQVIPIIDIILNEMSKGNEPFVTDEEINLLWDYMWLQSHRTDSGKLKLIAHLEGRSIENRTHPVELDEIRADKYSLNRFNEIYKNPGALEALLKATKRPSDMHFHISFCGSESESFITADNPVISTLNSNGEPFSQLMMPIDPFVYIEFQDKEQNCSENTIVQMHQDKVRYVNRAIVNTANYYVISDRPFDMALTGYIKNRFENKDWEPDYPFTKPRL